MRMGGAEYEISEEINTKQKVQTQNKTWLIIVKFSDLTFSRGSPTLTHTHNSNEQQQQ